MYQGEMNVSLYLTLDSAKFTPTEMGKLLGCMDLCEFRGDPQGLEKRPRDTNQWQIAEQVTFPEFSVTLIEETLDLLLLRIAGREDTFRSIADTGKATLALVVTSDGYPGIVFSPSQLATLAALGVTLDIDLYCDPKDTE